MQQDILRRAHPAGAAEGRNRRIDWNVETESFSEKTIIIADRGYESYNVMAHLLEKPNTDFLIRIKQNRSSMREVARLPMFELDCDIAFTITTTQTNEDKQKRYIFLQVPKKSKPGAKTRRGCWDFQSPGAHCPVPA